MNNPIAHVLAGIGAALAIGLLAYLDSMGGEWMWLMAPFGATTVLVFGVPASALAQPKNVIFGHLITAAIGIAFSQYVGVSPITLALATGLAVSAMLFTKTTHPPAGANPVLIMLTPQGWEYLISPVLIGVVIIVLLAQLQGWAVKMYSYRRAIRGA